MKKIFLLSAVAGTLILTSCGSEAGDKTEATEQQKVAESTGVTFTVDTVGSKVSWVGTKIGGSHAGDFKLTEGSLTVTDGKLSAGKFVISVASNNVTDIDEANGKSKLEGHLASADFFEVEKFPTASFEITGVTVADSSVASKVANANAVISGNLTLKGVTKNISFPAAVVATETSVEAKADFDIDRSEWGLNYKGPDNPQDWVISKSVNIKLDLKASK
ncbi:YceI family protein [Polluticaenibacter yanchengensis]|uniref:YceI family protein n=1 Tax=Polluticaenibacter yanchengensis TaxID=3014562 RepID=A0ABT4UP37_9BACT|nr:YceI family protein [Chitinophagaceae bacterium LY-5]